MASLSKTVNSSKAIRVAVTLVNVILEPTVWKSWREAGCSALDTGRWTQTAVRETREAWKRHR